MNARARAPSGSLPHAVRHPAVYDWVNKTSLKDLEADIIAFGSSTAGSDVCIVGAAYKSGAPSRRRRLSCVAI